MTETVWIGTSWKMNKTLAQAREFVDQVSAVPVPAGVQAFVLPPHRVGRGQDRLPADSAILLGAQNAHWDSRRLDR